MKEKTFHIVSLGCSKNSVDSDSMAQLFTDCDYTCVNTPRKAHIIIVNTCGFIDTAKEESYKTLAELAANKKKDQRFRLPPVV